MRASDPSITFSCRLLWKHEAGGSDQALWHACMARTRSQWGGMLLPFLLIAIARSIAHSRPQASSVRACMQGSIIVVGCGGHAANDSGGRAHAWHGTICGSLAAAAAAACLFTATKNDGEQAGKPCARERAEFEADARNSGSGSGC